MEWRSIDLVDPEEIYRRDLETLTIGTLARDLLLANLTPDQRALYERHGYFDVDVSSDVYRLNPDITVRLRDGDRYCLVVPGCPLADQLLARKLLLENDPEKFFVIANHFPSHESSRTAIRPRIRRDQHGQLMNLIHICLEHEGLPSSAVRIRTCYRDFDHCILVTWLIFEDYGVWFEIDRAHFFSGGTVEALTPVVEAACRQLREKTFGAECGSNEPN